MMMVKFGLIAVVVAAAACGGGKKGESTTVDDTRSEPTEAQPTDNSANMVPPEKMDEITRLLDRKRGIISRCLSIAVDNKELPKNSRGKVTLDIVIAPSGKAETIKVINTTLESKSLTDCVIGHVRDIQFPDLPKPYPTSYTYAFEAM